MRSFVGLLICLCLVGCTSDEVRPDVQAWATIDSLRTTPVSTPSFIEDGTRPPHEWPDEFPCIGIDQEGVWELGDDIKALSDHLLEVIKITVDNKWVLTQDELFVEMSLIGIPILDEDYNLLGYVGGPIHICITRNAPLPNGTHLATVELTSLSGKFYTYSWVFRFEK